MNSPKNDVAEITSDRWIWFHCPACGGGHGVPVEGERAWQWNGDLVKPTLKPSLLVNVGGGNKTQPICHIFITDGRIQYLADSTHDFAGKTIEMEKIYDAA